MSKDGLSKPYFHDSKGSIDSKVYINKCLRPILVPFIRERYNDDNYVFWPDLASCHYSFETIEYLNSPNYRMRLKGWQSPKCASSTSYRKVPGKFGRLSVWQRMEVKNKKQLIKWVTNPYGRRQIKVKKVANKRPYSLFWNIF